LNKAEELKSYLPIYYQESKQINAKCDSTGQELEDLYNNILDLTNQCFPQTATWGIEYWEKFLDIPINSAEDIKTRRAKVITKISRSSPMTPFEMRKILQNFIDGVLIVQYPNEYRFEVTLETKTKLENILDAVLREIEETKPAHLTFDIAINYITELLIKKVFSRWLSDPIQLCGTIDVSNNQYITTDGWSFKESLSGTISSNKSEELTVVSEKTFIVGDGKTLTEALSLTVNKYPSDEFKQSAEQNFISGVDGKSVNSSLYDGVSRIYSELIPRAAQDIYVKEVAK
jgi:hypothetical protein